MKNGTKPNHATQAVAGLDVFFRRGMLIAILGVTIQGKVQAVNA